LFSLLLLLQRNLCLPVLPGALANLSVTKINFLSFFKTQI